MLRAFEPLLILLELIVEHGEEPDFPALKPDEFVSVIDASVSVEAGEIPTVFLVLGFIEPEWKNVVKQFMPVALCHLLKINLFHVGIIL